LLPLLRQRVGVLRLPVLQVRLGCLQIWGFEGAEVVLGAGCCVACSLVPASVSMHTLVPSRAPVRVHEKVLVDVTQHWRWG
jgi:hypothetical protein